MERPGAQSIWAASPPSSLAHLSEGRPRLTQIVSATPVRRNLIRPMPRLSLRSDWRSESNRLEMGVERGSGIGPELFVEAIFRVLYLPTFSGVPDAAEKCAHLTPDRCLAAADRDSEPKFASSFEESRHSRLEPLEAHTGPVDFCSGVPHEILTICCGRSGPATPAEFARRPRLGIWLL